MLRYVYLAVLLERIDFGELRHSRVSAQPRAKSGMENDRRFRNAKDCVDSFSDSIIDGIYCNATWDTILCWPPTAAGEAVLLPCPPEKGVDSSKFASRQCSEHGHWLGKHGTQVTTGWTNYTDCFTPEVRELIRQLYSGSEKEAMIKLEIASGTRVMEMIGLSISLTALLISLFIFSHFRGLRNYRTKIHRNLFVAILLQVIIRLILYIDQYIIRKGAIYIPKSILTYRQIGIDNTPVLCEAFYVLLEYARTVMFMWMFIEGLYLHNKIAISVFHGNPNYRIFYAIGWGIPILMTAVWTTITAYFYRSTQCWWGYSFTPYFWILEGPRLTVIITNLIFLLNIIRVLITKLRETNSSEAQQVWKAAKAAIVLLPLLGITNILMMVHGPLNRDIIEFALWSYGTHFLTSFQGFFISLLYCFINGEVRDALSKQWQVYVFNRDLQNRRQCSISFSLYSDVRDLQMKPFSTNGDEDKITSDEIHSPDKV